MSLTNRVRLVAAQSVLWAAACSFAASSAQAADELNFVRDVRPILSNHCFACHGPDDEQRQAGLRLDLAEAALQPADSGAVAIVPGQPEQSELVRRIMAEDAGERMPPEPHGKPLTEAQKHTLRAWVAAGAPYHEHWAFLPPERPAPPAVQDAAWPLNGIDRFILARLEAEGLHPAPAADRETLLRRVTLDLTGLPPTLDEIDAFLADDRPGAYERVVERLLASPRYGERMAVDWLDAARFADTHGYHIDSGRDMTRWREWVIDAFNANLGFDRFTIEQLAGDLLPSPTIAQQIASGFNRNHMINFEGGAIPEEYHNAYIVDRVNTTGAVWLGLSVGCAQCHNHKYDPLTQREFYQLYAFFHQVPEAGLDGSKGNARPFLPAPSVAEQAELTALEQQLTALAEQLTGPWPEVDAQQAAWEADLPAGGDVWRPAEVASIVAAGGAEFTLQDDGSYVVSGANPATDAYTVVLPVAAGGLTGLRVELLPHDGLAGGGPGRSINGNVVLTNLKVEIAPAAGEAWQPVALASAAADFSQDNFPVASAIDDDPQSGWALHPQVGRPHTVDVALAESLSATHPVQIRLTLEFRSQFGQHQPGRLRFALSDAPSPLSAPPAEVLAVLATPADQRGPEQAAALRDFFRAQVCPTSRAALAQQAAAQQQRDTLLARIPTVMVMSDGQPRETFVLVRGQYDKPGDQVAANTPSFLPPLPADAPRNRLGLAQWLVQTNHPLVARVIVNRYWQMCFGTGLVKTSEDFGSQGELPSHPELLDWLASEFRTPSAAPEGSGSAQAWDVKAIVRLIVTSATYRQAAAIAPELHARDPENRLLARGPRFRLQAEFIRDLALATSGLLDPRIGGPSVNPYQPPGIWEELASREDGYQWTAQTFTQSHGADLYRRTMYTFWKRTAPPPSLATFDAPDRETCIVRRARTNTPLQALVLLNDPTYVEAARKLAERILTTNLGDDAERLTWAVRTVLGRRPKPEELGVLQELLEQQRASFASDLVAAEALLSVGESPRNLALAPAELAAWATVASVLLNLDEAVTRG